MDAVPVLVAYHSIYWIRAAVESYLEHFPGDRLLVVNNNPRRGELGWYPYCEEERDWLASHPGVLLLDNPRLPGSMSPNGWLEHGTGIDAAVSWCRTHGVRVMVHLEPDCLVTGRQWRENLLEALARGAWMAGSHCQSHGPIHPTPSAWLVAEIRTSFRPGSWAGEEDDPQFKEFMNPAALENDRSPQGRWVRLVRYWDTGHAGWFECARRGRAALVEAPDFRHYWYGSVGRRFSDRTLADYYPELGPYLERGRQRKPPRTLEECPYREHVEEETSSETASCRLVQQLSGVQDPAWCRVQRKTCLACSASFWPSPERINPVVASLLYGLAEKVIERGGVPGCTEASALELRCQAEIDIDLELC
jgi:hypothetical protein